MTGLQADRAFFYIMLLAGSIITLILVWQFLGAVVLAITVAVVLQPMYRWLLRRTGGRKGPATALTLLTTLILVVIPVLVGIWILLGSLVSLSNDVERVMQDQQPVWIQQMEGFERWLSSTEIGEWLDIEVGDVSRTVRESAADAGPGFVDWLAEAGISIFNMILPTTVFVALLGTLLANSESALRILKELSPLDDAIDQLFLDRLRIMTKTMMLSIVVVAVVQGLATGLLMALGGTPHIVPLTISATIMAILPGGAAIVAVPVGIAHLFVGNTWSGMVIIIGTLTLVSALGSQVRPLMVSKEAYLNRAFMLLSVFSGLAIFGFMGVVYGPLIMILFTTMLEVYLKYFRPGPPSVALENSEGESSS